MTYKLLSKLIFGSEKHHRILRKSLAAYLTEVWPSLYPSWADLPNGAALAARSAERLAAGKCSWPVAVHVAAHLYGQRFEVHSKSSEMQTFGEEPSHPLPIKILVQADESMKPKLQIAESPSHMVSLRHPTSPAAAAQPRRRAARPAPAQPGVLTPANTAPVPAAGGDFISSAPPLNPCSGFGRVSRKASEDRFSASIHEGYFSDYSSGKSSDQSERESILPALAALSATAHHVNEENSDGPCPSRFARSGGCPGAADWKALGAPTQLCHGGVPSTPPSVLVQPSISPGMKSLPRRRRRSSAGGRPVSNGETTTDEDADEPATFLYAPSHPERSGPAATITTVHSLTSYDGRRSSPDPCVFDSTQTCDRFGQQLNFKSPNSSEKLSVLASENSRPMSSEKRYELFSEAMQFLEAIDSMLFRNPGFYYEKLTPKKLNRFKNGITQAVNRLKAKIFVKDQFFLEFFPLHPDYDKTPQDILTLEILEAKVKKFRRIAYDELSVEAFENFVRFANFSFSELASAFPEYGYRFLYTFLQERRF